MRVLIVDDEPSFLKSFERLLHTKKDIWDIVTEVSSAKAQELLKESKFDVLVTDVLMNQIDGFALLKAAKEINPNTQVLMMTGAGTIKSAVEAMQLGAWDYILKPIDNVEIITKLENLDTFFRATKHADQIEQEIQDIESTASNTVVNLQFQYSELLSKEQQIQAIINNDNDSNTKIEQIKELYL